MLCNSEKTKYRTAAQRISEPEGRYMLISIKKKDFSILHIFILPVEFSKYDFWIPGKISHRHSKKSIKKYFLSRSKKFVEKVGKYFSRQKNVRKHKF